MKKVLYFITMAFLAGCQNEAEELNQAYSVSNLEISASVEDEINSRTYFDPNTFGNTETITNIFWETDDKLSAFFGNTDNQCLTLSDGAGTLNAKFSGANISIGGNTETGSNPFLHVAYYPYNESVSIRQEENNYKISTTWPGKQSYKENSFSKDIAPMVAVTEGFAFPFKNVAAFVSFPLKSKENDEITIIKAFIESTSHFLSGDCEITASKNDYPSVEVKNTGSKKIILDCGEEGVALNSTEATNFVFTLPPNTYEAEDLKYTFIDKSGKYYEYVAQSEENLERAKCSHYQPKEFEAKPDKTMAVDTESLKNALQSIQGTSNTEAITIQDNIELTEEITVSATTEIDLNGHSLNVKENTIKVAEGVNLTITDGSASQTPNTRSSQTVESTNLIEGTGDIIKAAANSTINIGAGVSLKTTGANSCCIWIPAGADNVTVNTGGNLLATTAGAAVISHNGNLTTGEINITGGSVIHEADVAVYIAGQAKLKINGNACISGTTGVEIRAGELDIDGATISTESEFTEVSNNNGTTITGAAIAVSQHTTEKPINVTIKNGTFTGKYALYEKDLQDDPTESVTMSVTNGTFNGSIYSENCTKFITGGTFSDPSACQYLGDNANVTVNMASNYEGPGFSTKNGQTVTLNLNQTTYTVTNPLVGSTGTISQAFHFEQGSTVSINNGTLTSSQARMFMQNYADLTLSGVTLSPSIPTSGLTSNYYYVLSNNNGSVNIKSGTIITAPNSSTTMTVFAMDVCKNQSYPNITATIEEGVTINGNIEYTGGGEAWKLNITGGTLNGKIVVADEYKEEAKDGISITGGTFSDASAFDYLADNANVSLGNDMTISKPIAVGASNVVINLNSYDVTATQSDAFEITGSLNITGNEDAIVQAGTDKQNTGNVCAVWAHNGGSVTISGGHYKVYEDKDGKRNDCIYAGSNNQNTSGTIIINGGKFEYGSEVTQTGVDYNGHVFLLNCADTQPNSNITVNKGLFKNHAPSYEPNGTNEVKLGDNAKVYKNNNELVNEAHNTNSGEIWYEVK